MTLRCRQDHWERNGIAHPLGAADVAASIVGVVVDGYGINQ